MARHEDSEDGARIVDICDACGRLLTGQDDPLLDPLPDSSFLHPCDPRQDGRRLVIACSPDHLAALQQEYQRHPFDPAELDAGKMLRVLRQRDSDRQRVPLVDLAAAAESSTGQVQRAVEWLNARYPGWLRG